MYKHGTHYKYQVIHRVACFCTNIIKTGSSRKDYPLIYIIYAKAQIPWVLHLYDIFPWLEDQSLAVNALTSKELFGTKERPKTVCKEQRISGCWTDMWKREMSET